MKATGRFVSILMVGWLSLCVGVTADESCGQAGNLTYNCNFDNFQDRGNGNSTPDGWLPWVTMGSPVFDIDVHGSACGAPAQRIWSDGGTWTAGLYQQVGVTAGKGYLARVQWSAPRCNLDVCRDQDMERKIGIDPFGGTDPLSPHVVWGASCWLTGSMPDVYVSAYAEGATITIFVWTHHPRSHGQDEIFVDGVVLIEDTGMAPRATQTPTPLPTPTRKPTQKPAAVRATATDTPLPPSPTPTETATPVPTEVPTETPIPTDTATATPTPTPTDTPTPAPPTNTPPPTRTPLPTVVPVARVVSGVEEGRGGGSLPAVAAAAPANGVLLYVAAAALLGVVLSAGLLAWLWLHSRRAAGDPEQDLS